MAIKAKDLAEKLGVSRATVSLLLNNKSGLSDKTRKELTDKVNAMGLGYMFSDKNNECESSTLTEPLNKSIAFVIYKRGGELMEQTPFFPLILDGLEATAKKHGYRLMIHNIVRREDMQQQMSYLLSSGCKGIVVFATEMIGDDVEPFQDLKIPVVLLDNYYLDRTINAVTLNNEQGTYALVKSLYEKGHRKIGYLGSGVNIASFQERKDCFFRALRKFGINGMESYCFDIGYPEVNAYNGFVKVAESRSPMPTAFLSDNDVVAFGAVKAMTHLGIRVPQDISVVGFDDRPICQMIDPPLTTVRIPRFLWGGEAVELLVNKIEQAQHRIESHVKVEVCVELIERESVAEIPPYK